MMTNMSTSGVMSRSAKVAFLPCRAVPEDLRLLEPLAVPLAWNLDGHASGSCLAHRPRDTETLGKPSPDALVDDAHQILVPDRVLGLQR